MVPVFQDNFHRADENLSASPNWTNDGIAPTTAAVRSNMLAAPVTVTGDGAVFRSPDLGYVNHYVEVILASYVTSPGMFAACRAADHNNFVGVIANSTSGGIEVWKRVTSTFTRLTLQAGAAVNDVVRLSVTGDNYSLYKNGSLLISAAIGAAGLNSTRQGVISDFGVQNPVFSNYLASVIP